MNVQAAYDHWSDTYDADKNLTRDLDAAVTQQLLTRLQCSTAIELGCGTGKNTLLLAQLANQVHAIDFSAHMLEKAKAKVNLAHVSFSIADITQRWPFNSESADLITCNLVLEHIEDLSFIFSEAARVLINTGHLFISELHPYRQYRGTKANFQRNQETVEIQAFTHHLSDFINTAKKYGLLLEDVQEWWHELDHNKPPRTVSFLFRK